MQNSCITTVNVIDGFFVVVVVLFIIIIIIIIITPRLIRITLLKLRLNRTNYKLIALLLRHVQ